MRIEGSAANGDTTSILQYLEKVQRIYPEIHYAIVLYPDGRVMASTFKKEIPQDILNIPANPCPPDCGMQIIDSSEVTTYEGRGLIADGKGGTIRVGFIDNTVSR